jgi:predicted small secreted protein
MKRTLFLLIATIFALIGCNTLEGAGKDIQKAGQAIEDSVKKK